MQSIIDDKMDGAGWRYASTVSACVFRDLSNGEVDI